MEEASGAAPTHCLGLCNRISSYAWRGGRAEPNQEALFKVVNEYMAASKMFC